MERRNLIWRPLNFAIVDEIDSILVDEARTPLIISEAREEPTEKYTYYANIVNLLQPCSTKKRISKGLLNELMNEGSKNQEEDGDYYIDEKTKTASLSGKGIAKLEELLNVENIYKDMGFEEIHHIENALRAKAVYIRDIDYIVTNGEILIVDEHTGRTMPGRRFSEGLHQAIEAKEQVQIQRESQTMATITYQNFFKQYQKLAGMTGTAATEAEEFQKIYELEVVIIPTNKEIIRVDKNDKVYFDQHAKWKFVKEYIKFYHEIGQPLLIGTADIATSEFVSKMLEKDAITHYVLNAKFHEQEAHIVANAGKYQSVVVATNMAGRGTDIKLEAGLNEKLAQNYAKWCKKLLGKGEYSLQAIVYSQTEYALTLKGIQEVFTLTDEQTQQAQQVGIKFATNDTSSVSEQEHIPSSTLTVSFNTKKNSTTDRYAKIKFEIIGKERIEKDFHYGLFILGTEKHESRRIDNQLRGRAGRQGDPGVSVFFVALDDTLMRKMGGERIKSIASLLLSKEELGNLELTQSQFTNAIIRSQKEIEARHFSTRKHLFDYDSVINKQRQNIYHTRDTIIEASIDEEKKAERTAAYQKQFLIDAQYVLNTQISIAENTQQSITDLLEILHKEFGLECTNEQKEQFSKLDYNTLNEQLEKKLVAYFQSAFETLDKQLLFTIFRDVNLQVIDKLRVAHLDEMQYLKDKVGFMGYAQLDPLIVYKKESFEKFQDLLARITSDTASILIRVNFTTVANQQEAQLKFIEAVEQHPELLEKLKSASKFTPLVKERGALQGNKSSLSGQNPTLLPLQQGGTSGNDPRKMLFSDEDGVEIFEVEDSSSTPETVSTVILPEKRKIRPNDPCPCGSGKKYKKCCGKGEIKE
jgi:preprotein translocase subunit SecA